MISLQATSRTDFERHAGCVGLHKQNDPPRTALCEKEIPCMGNRTHRPSHLEKSFPQSGAKDISEVLFSKFDELSQPKAF
jgi:hypothetical protein